MKHLAIAVCSRQMGYARFTARLLAISAFTLVACDPPTTTAPLASRPHADISDAAHAGNPLFLFLPPVVDAAAAPAGATFDAAASPIVDICALATSTSCASGPPIASYSRTSGTGGELVTVDLAAQTYSVKWKTSSFSLSTAINYRITVRIGAVTLGYADVDIVSSNNEAKLVDATRYVALVNTKILNIKFAIYRGAADPFPIVIDAAALSATTVELLSAATGGLGSFPTTPPKTIALRPGGYTLRYYAGGDYGSLSFSVTPAGKVDFDASLDGAASGRGTATLTVGGYTVGIDARPLTAPLLDLTSVITFPTSAPYTVRVLPGLHRLRYYAATPQYPTVAVNITNTGKVDYDPALEGLLTGSGTSSVTVHGRTVSIDATRLSTPEWFLLSVATFPTGDPKSVTLLPGDHFLGYYAGTALLVPGVPITITFDGNVQYDPSVEGMLEGVGTAALVVHGSAIVFDGTALAPSELFLLSLFRFPSSPATTQRLLPGPHYFGYSAGSPFTPPGVPFIVDGNGNVDFAASLDGAVSGRGTRTFTATGRPIQITVEMTGVTTFRLTDIGTYASGTALSLLPGIHGLVVGSRDISITVDDTGRLVYDAVAFPYLCGAGSATLVVKDAAC